MEKGLWKYLDTIVQELPRQARSTSTQRLDSYDVRD